MKKIIYFILLLLLIQAIQALTCKTLPAVMQTDILEYGFINCRAEIDGEFDVVYCEQGSERQHLRKNIDGTYSAKIYDLDPDKPVKIFVIENNLKHQCLPVLNLECIDSDGKDYETLGHATGYIGKIGNSMGLGTDFCKDEETLFEFYCEGNVLRNQEHKCKCLNGKCVTNEASCKTLGTKMMINNDGSGYIGCDIKVNGGFNLSKSYCIGEKTNIKKYLKLDAFGKTNQYYATLSNLNPSEKVKVYIYSNNKYIECMPKLNLNPPVIKSKNPIKKFSNCKDSDGLNSLTKGRTNGINEKGNIEIINTEFISHNYNQLHKKYWNLYKSGFEIFLGTLPSTQFYGI